VARRRVPAGSLQRSLSALTIGVVKGQEARRDALAPMKLGEMVQHQKLEISGRIGSSPVTTIQTVEWPYPFVYAPAQTDSDFEKPHFNYGIEFDHVPSSVPHIMVAVIDWLDDDDGFSTGAKLAVTAFIPGAAKKRQLNAIAHLTFWGFGAPSEDEGSE
jgi:hypothetical protein